MHHNVPDATSLRRSVRWGYNTGDTRDLDREHSLYWVLLNGCVEIHENLIENSWCTSQVLETFNILPWLFSTTQKLEREHPLYWVYLNGFVEIHENLIENSRSTSQELELFNTLPCPFPTTQELDREHPLYWVLFNGCVEILNLLPCPTCQHYPSRTYNAVLLNLQWIDQKRKTQNTWTQHSNRNPGHSEEF